MPAEVQLRYPGEFEVSEVTAFMNSDEMQTRMSCVFMSIATVEELKAKLPEGMFADVVQPVPEVRNSYIRLFKPFLQAGKVLLQYQRNVRDDLNATQRRLV